MIDSKNSTLILNLPSWIILDFIDKDNNSYSNLSYGQQFLMKFIYNILNQLNIIKNRLEYRHINLLLDEVELGLHPKWQKEFLSLLISILKTQTDFTFNIILTSHSPFLISDLPKENVIFLKEGKQIDALDKKQTFGANIHTLLSDGFFMSDGLMGEFAKGKIEEIKKFYELVQRLEKKLKPLLNNFHRKKRVKLKKKYKRRILKFRYIQSIIGEPFLKTIMKNYLDELELIFSSDGNLIDNEIKQLQLKIDKLKNLKK